MKAYRNIGGSVVEVEVDIGLDGQPLLPPDTTVDPKPEPQPGHYVTVVGNSWVQIPIPEQVLDFSYEKQLALEKLKNYKDWYLEQPVEHEGRTFDADSVARVRLTQALVIHSTTGYLPPAWIDANNQPFTITTIQDLHGIISAVQTAFSNRFFEMENIRQQILNAQDKQALDLIEIPSIPNNLI